MLFPPVGEPDDDEALRRVINTPKRGIGETTVKKVLACAIASGVSMYRVMLSPQLYGLDVNKGDCCQVKRFRRAGARLYRACRRGCSGLRCGPPHNEGHRAYARIYVGLNP